jgi:hypothetical protein
MPSTNALPLSRTSTSSHHSSAPLWDPRKTLQIVSDDRCVGHAHSKGRKCRIRLAMHNLYTGDSILQELSRRQPEPDAVRRKLQGLAEVMLCPRWHRDQAQIMVDDWMSRIEEDYPSSLVEVETQRASFRTPASSSGRNSGSVTLSRRETVSPATASTSISTEVETLRKTIAEMEERAAAMEERAATMAQRMQQMVVNQEMILQSAQRVTELVDTQSSTSISVRTTPNVSRVSTSNGSSNVSSTTSSPTSTVDNTPSTSTSARTTPTVSRVSTSDISSLALSRTSTISSTRSTSTPPSGDAGPSSSPTCAQTHVRRRAIDDECPICREDFLLRDKLVWCRNSCGRTVHRACFEAWEVECTAGGREPTCGLCRAEWVQCGCGDDD